MIINFETSNRKELAKKIGEFYNVTPKYLKVPTCEYQINDIFVTKEGNLRVDDGFDVTALLKFLKGSTALTFKLPENNFRKFINLRAGLIKKALGIKEFRMSETEITYIWEDSLDDTHLEIYKAFLQRMSDMIGKQKRTNETTTEIINEKYSFRCFLIRLGYIGKEYKLDRKILLEKLTGSSAFRGDEKNEK